MELYPQYDSLTDEYFFKRNKVAQFFFTRNGNVEELKKLFARAKPQADRDTINESNGDGWTALHLAAKYSGSDAIEKFNVLIIIKHGVCFK